MNNNLLLEDYLKKYPPFKELSNSEIQNLFDKGEFLEFKPNSIILSGEINEDNFLWFVIEGEVRIWTPRSNADFDDYIDLLKPGSSFGYVSSIDAKFAPPKAVSLTKSALFRIPASTVKPYFLTDSGVKYLAKQLQSNIEKPSIRSINQNFSQRIGRDLIKKNVTKCDENVSIKEAAEIMTKNNSSYIITESSRKGIGILTDSDIRSKFVSKGKNFSEPVKNFMTFPAKTFYIGASSFDLMIYMLDNNLQHLPLHDENGSIAGIVNHKDFLSLPSSSSFSLNKKILNASLEELKLYYQQLRDLKYSMFKKNYNISQISEVSSIVIENIIRRSIDLSLKKYNDFSKENFSWLTLGSVARREVMFSSDLESAIVINDEIAGDLNNRIRMSKQIAQSVTEDLHYIGLSPDSHGVTGGSNAFSKSISDWKKNATNWINNPYDNNALVKAATMFDARSIWGSYTENPVSDIYLDIQNRPQVKKLLLQESLTAKATMHTAKERLSFQTGYINIKKQALLPIVNLARWSALTEMSKELSTVKRLKTAAKVGLIGKKNSEMLIDVFNIVQKIRFQSHLVQIEKNEKPTDKVFLKKISKLDKSLLTQAIREIAHIQKKMLNLSHYTDPDEWILKG